MTSPSPLDAPLTRSQTMEAYLLSTQPSSSSTRDPSLKPSIRRPKRPSLQQAVHALLPADGRAVDSLESITRINRALVGTLGQADNPVTGSTAYSRTLQVQVRAVSSSPFHCRVADDVV